MIKKIISLVLCGLVLVSCSRNAEVKEENTTKPSENQALTFQSDGTTYQLMVPFNESPVRFSHEARGVYREDTSEITRELLDLSKQYFDAATLYITEGQVLSDERYTNVLRFNSEQVSEGLNPAADEVFETESGKNVTQPILLQDLFEIDFYNGPSTDSELAGISIALAVSGEVEISEGVFEKIRPDQLRTYSENAARKLMSYIRSMPNMNLVPIYIGIYSLEKADSSIPGGYLAGAYFQGNSGQFTNYETKWVILPSNQAHHLIPQLASEYDVFYDVMRDFLPSEQVGAVGSAQVVNGEVKKLKITIHTSGKTYLETAGVGQFALQQLNQRFENSNFDILIDIQVLGKTKMVIERKHGQVKVVEW